MMRKHIGIAIPALFILLLFLSSFTYLLGNLTRTTYYYSFANAQSIEQLKVAQEQLNTLLHVTSVKYEYKEEAHKGQFIIIVEEASRKAEGDAEFSIKLVKDIIIQNGMSPVDFTYEVEKL